MCAASLFFCSARSFLSPRTFRFSVSGGGWQTSASGQIQSGILPVDLRSDLAMHNGWQFHGTALIRVKGRHRIVLEGSPLQFSGLNLLTRNVTYNGRTYLVQETVASEAEVSYAFAGYQYEILARPRGRLGVRAGGAYLDASGRLRSLSTGTEASRSYTIGLPVVGVEGRAMLIPRRLDIGGDVAGMTLGDYGRYVQGGGNIGMLFGAFAVRAGYRAIDADVHESSGSNPAGVRARFCGPVFSLVFHTR